MKKTEYLYGVEPSFFQEEEYEYAIHMKVELGRAMLEKIRTTTKDEEHYQAVEKAVSFNRSLIGELHE